MKRTTILLLLIVVANVVLMSSCNINNPEVKSAQALRKLKAELKESLKVSNFSTFNKEELLYFKKHFNLKDSTAINKLNEGDFSRFIELMHVQIDLKKDLEKLAKETNENAKRLGVKIRCEVAE